MNSLKLLFFFIFIPAVSFSQVLTQTLKGTITDKESKAILPGASVFVKIDSSETLGQSSNENGEYKLTGIPVGRHTVVCKYLGYKTMTFNSILFNSAKEVVLNFELEEDLVLSNEIVVTARKNNGDPLNEMATVSARSFTIEETDRYAGSRGDPSRMASNFAGVQGADDSRNDIVVRGNSPSGVLWRLEGIDIPNPNHFAIPGTTGGPISIINNKYLANSDFYTGAFPAEFGNGTAGVFDLKMRNGNNEKREHSFQFGFLGTEVASEGPLNKKTKSSYMVNYRYSSLALFSGLGISIGTDAVPKYQDGAFRLNFPMKKNASLSVWGIGGFSTIDIIISKQKPEERNLYGDNDRDQYFTSWMGTLGANYKKSLSKRIYLNIALASSTLGNKVHHEYIFFKNVNGTREVDAVVPQMKYTYVTNQKTANVFINHKIDNRLSLKYGLLNTLWGFNYHDSARQIVRNPSSDSLANWATRWNTNKSAILVQGFVQAKYRFNKTLTGYLGWHSQYFSLSQSISVFEPRASLKYELSKTQTLSFGTGIYSQMQQPYLYFYTIPGNSNPHNEKMDFTRSRHFVLAYDHIFKKSMRFKLETYYQSLYNIPITIHKSSFSLINSGSGFSRFRPDSLQNNGTGYNYGLEMTLEKYFAGNYYFLISGSVYESKYKGSDGLVRNTDFNGRYALNFLFAKDFIVNKIQTLQIGTKVTTAGGKYYSPPDTLLSDRESDIVPDDKLRNSLRFPDYFRFDLRISYKWNKTRIAHEIALDLVNVLNTKNVLKLSYVPSADGNNIKQEYQLGRLPLFYYKMDF